MCGACLAATLLGPVHGFFQRAGLSVGDAWLAATCARIIPFPERR
jgi:hypothetical protein